MARLVCAAMALVLLVAPFAARAQAVYVTGNPQAATPAEDEEAQAEKHYWEIDGFQEVFVDDDNSLYANRPYQGIIPRVRDELEQLRAPEQAMNAVMWIGYQHRRLFSRVFVQTSQMPVFTVLQKAPTHIVISFERTTFRDENSRREIVTGDFNTKVGRIVPQAVGKDRVEVHVHLKEPGSFLYRQEGHYLYLDVERSATE